MKYKKCDRCNKRGIFTIVDEEGETYGTKCFLHIEDFLFILKEKPIKILRELIRKQIAFCPKCGKKRPIKFKKRKFFCIKCHKVIPKQEITLD